MKFVKTFNFISFKGDLGSIDDKYDIAISTSCAILDYVVVDTMETAQACVEMLKRNNLGIATFLALDKVSFLHASTLRLKSTGV